MNWTTNWTLKKMCRFGFMLCAVGMLLSLHGCGKGSDDSSQKPANAGGGKAVNSSAETGKKIYRIAVIPKGTTHEFWKSVHAGAAQAAKELGNVEIEWKGAFREDDREGQINVVGDFITKKVDGICLAPLDSQALVAAVLEAKQAGIPCIIFDSALADENAGISYVATDNYNGGAIAARRLAETLNGEGDVILLRYNVGSESTEQREQGFLETLEKEFPKIKILSSNEYSGTTPESSLEKCQQLLLKFGKEVDGVFAVCEPNSTGMLGALEEAGLATKVKFIAFDPSPKLVQAMAENKIHGIVLQDPVKMGYLAVKNLVAHLEGQKIEKRIPTGEFMATPENMNGEEMKKLLEPDQFRE